jgi:hypothetical protein
MCARSSIRGDNDRMDCVDAAQGERLSIIGPPAL